MNSRPIQVVAPVAPDLEILNRLNKEIIESGQYTNFGDKVSELEGKLRHLLGLRYLRLVSNGTAALQIILSMFAKKNRRFVITTPFTFPATASAIIMSGYEPYFVDINPQTLNLDPSLTAQALREIAPDTAAILPVHVFGNPCDPIEFESLSTEYDVPLLFDACHTFSAIYMGKPLCSYGQASAMSYHPTKIFHCGEGGGVILGTGCDHELAREYINFGFSKSGEINAIAGNAKVSEFNAAIGLSVINAIPNELAKRKSIAAIYTSSFADINEINFQRKPQSHIDNHQYYPILLANRIREKVIKKLNTNNIFPRRYFSPSLCDTRSYSNYCKYPCLNSKVASLETLCLPIYGTLPEEKVKLIADLVIEGITD